MNTTLPPESGNCIKHGAFPIRSIEIMGRVIRSSHCPTCSKEAADREEAERAEKERAERQAKIEARLEQAGIPMLFRDRTFANYEVKTPGAGTRSIASRRSRPAFRCSPKTRHRPCRHWVRFGTGQDRTLHALPPTI
jgi:hypothetical protein